MPSRSERRNRASAAPVPAPETIVQQPFEDVRNTLLRAAADSQSNELTEKILNEFLRTAASLLTATTSGGEAIEALVPALLSVACILNAPVGFLDCILCTPWSRTASKALSGGPTSNAFEAEEAKRRHLVNLPLQSNVLDAMLDFVYSKRFTAVLPPMMQPSQAEQAGTHMAPDTRTLVAAALDGGTALHVAAASGRNSHVTWLLASGADLQLRTNAGDLPIQLVPKCEELHPFSTRSRECNCSVEGAVDATACQSQKTREHMAWATLCNLSHGVWAWLLLLLTSILCVLGVDGCHKTFFRRELGAHADHIRHAKQASARKAVRERMQVMRQGAEESRRLVDAAIACYGPLSSRFDHGEPGGDTAMTCSWQAALQSCETHQKTRSGFEEQASAMHDTCAPDMDLLLKSSLNTVSALQDFGLRPLQVKSTGRWMDLPRALEDQRYVQAKDSLPQGYDLSDCQVPPAEQAEIFLCMAQAVFLSYRSQGHPEEGAKAANVRMGIAYDNGRLLWSRLERHSERYSQDLGPVRLAFVQTLHANICLVLATHAQRSASPAAVRSAQQLLSRWDELLERGVVADAGLADDVSVACLSGWRRTAAADLDLVEALRGRPMEPDEQLSQAIATAALRNAEDSRWLLNRPATKEAVNRLKEVLELHAGSASKFILEIAASATNAASAEMEAAEQLRAVLGAKGSHLGTWPAVEALQAAILQASQFQRLEAEVSAARQVYKRWEAKSHALHYLEAEVARAKAPLTLAILSSADAPESGDWAEVKERIDRLERAISKATEADIPASGAKRVQQEMRAQLHAAQAAAKLEALMSSRPCGSASLKAAVMKAEAAASSAAANSACGHTAGLQTLQPMLHAAKRQLEIERSTELLQKAVNNCKLLADLPKLEAAILAARKTGNVSADVLRAASELRASLDQTARHKLALDSAVKALARSKSADDAEAVEAAVAAAGSDHQLLTEEVKAAEDALVTWKAFTAAEARLARALKDGSSSALLARAVQDAIAAGIKDLGEAQKVLRAMQSLEAVMQRVQDRQGSITLLQDRIAAAEQAGVWQSLIGAARALEKQVLLSEAKCGLELALKPRADRSMALQASALHAALETAEFLLSGRQDKLVVGDGTAPGAAASQDAADLYEALASLAEEAKSMLNEEAREQELIDQSKAEQQRLRRQRLQAEREERERERQAKLESEQVELKKIAKLDAEKAAAAKEAVRSNMLENGVTGGQHTSAEVLDAAPEPLVSKLPKAPGKDFKAALLDLQPRQTGESLVHVTCSSSESSRPFLDDRKADSAAPGSELSSTRQPSPSGSGLSANSSESLTPRPQSTAGRPAWSWDPLHGSQPLSRPLPQLPVPLPEPTGFRNPEPTPARDCLPLASSQPASNGLASDLLARQLAAMGGIEPRLRDAPIEPPRAGRTPETSSWESIRPARLQLAASTQDLPQLSPGFKPPLATNTSGAGALAYGAPGLKAFSNGIQESIGTLPARPELPGTSLGFSALREPPHSFWSLTDGSQTGAYPGQLLMLNGLDLAAGRPERSPGSSLLRSGSDSTSEAAKLADQARASSPFPGAHQWGASEHHQQVHPALSNPTLASYSLSQPDPTHPDLNSVLQHTLSNYGDFVYHASTEPLDHPRP